MGIGAFNLSGGGGGGSLVTRSKSFTYIALV